MQLNFSYKKHSAAVVMNMNTRCRIVHLCGTTIANTSKCLLPFDLFRLPLPMIARSCKESFFFHTCSFTISFYEKHCTAQDFVDTLKDVFSTVSFKCLELTNTKISKNPWKKYNWLYNYWSFCNITATEVVCMVSFPLRSFLSVLL